MFPPIQDWYGPLPTFVNAETRIIHQYAAPLLDVSETIATRLVIGGSTLYGTVSAPGVTLELTLAVDAPNHKLDATITAHAPGYSPIQHTFPNIPYEPFARLHSGLLTHAPIPLYLEFHLRLLA